MNSPKQTGKSPKFERSRKARSNHRRLAILLAVAGVGPVCRHRRPALSLGADPVAQGGPGDRANPGPAGRTGGPRSRREAHRRAEVRGRRGRVRPPPRGRPQERRHRPLDLDPDPRGPAADLPPRLRDGGPLLQGRGLAGRPSRARHARPLLRQFARHLLSRLLLGHRPARAGRSQGTDRPQVLDAGPDLRRGLAGARARLAGPRPPGRPHGRRVPRLLEPGRLSGRRARHAARRRGPSHGRSPRRHVLLDAAPVERDLASRPAGAPRQGREDQRRRRRQDPRFPGRPSRRDDRRPPRRARIVEPPRRTSRGRSRGPLRARPRPHRRVRRRGRPGRDPQAPDGFPRPPTARYAWWATGQALLAEYTRGESAPDALVRARQIALEGVERFPDSPGGQHCRHIVRSIEAPEYSIEAMRLDAPGRRSVRLTHRNLDRVFLRAYPVDLEALVKSSKDYSIFPQGEEARRIIEGRRPDAAWQAGLAKASDYRDHQTYADLPATLAPGLYLVAASAREDFGGGANKMVGLSVVVGDLVLVKREGGGPTAGAGGEEVIAVSGATGRPLAGVTVDLYAFDWRKGHTKVGSKTTDAGGRVWFAPTARGGSYFLLARKGRDIAFDPDYLYLQTRTEPREERSALVYTDRSIYRPGQKLFWKVLAYRGRQDLGRIRPDAGAAVTVWLEDINEPARRPSHGLDEHVRHGQRRVRHPGGRPASRRLGPAHIAERLRRGARRGIQAPDLRGRDQGPGETAAPEPFRRPQRRGPVLFRPARHWRRGRLAGQARAGLPSLVVVGDGRRPQPDRRRRTGEGRTGRRHRRRLHAASRREESRGRVGHLLPLYSIGRRHGRGRRDALGLALVPARLCRCRGRDGRGQRLRPGRCPRGLYGHEDRPRRKAPGRQGRVARRPARRAGRDAPPRRSAPARRTRDRGPGLPADAGRPSEAALERRRVSGRDPAPVEGRRRDGPGDGRARRRGRGQDRRRGPRGRGLSPALRDERRIRRRLPGQPGLPGRRRDEARLQAAARPEGRATGGLRRRHGPVPRRRRLERPAPALRDVPRRRGLGAPLDRGRQGRRRRRCPGRRGPEGRIRGAADGRPRPPVHERGRVRLRALGQQGVGDLVRDLPRQAGSRRPRDLARHGQDAEGNGGRKGRGRAAGLHVRPQSRPVRPARPAADRRTLSVPARDAAVVERARRGPDGVTRKRRAGAVCPAIRLSGRTQLAALSGYGIGGPGRRGGSPEASSAAS